MEILQPYIYLYAVVIGGLFHGEVYGREGLAAVLGAYHASLSAAYKYHIWVVRVYCDALAVASAHAVAVYLYHVGNVCLLEMSAVVM